MGKESWISTREKIMLSVLLLTVIALLVFFFAYKPMRERLATLEAEELALIEQIAEAEKIYELIEDAKNEGYLTNLGVGIAENMFFDSLIQENIILVLEGLLDDSNVSDRAISFAQVNEVSLGGEFPTHYENTMDVSISYTASYDDIKNFIHSVEVYEKVIYIRNVSFSASGLANDPLISGSITLGFVSIPLFDQSRPSKQNWELDGDYGRENPFMGLEDGTAPYESSVIEALGEEPETEVNNNFDFFVSVLPEAADKPSVTVGTANDPRRKSYITRNSNEIERVEFIFEQNDNGYLARYKTVSAIYPSNDDWVTFEPKNGDLIRVLVSSYERININDLSGLLLNIVNNSGCMVEVHIISEDINSPRIEITGNDSNYMVTWR